jgi:ERCC4-related helicase
MSEGFQDYKWRVSYRTSAKNPEGNPTDVMHEFYIPALRLASTYDRVAGYFRSSSLAAASQGYTSFVNHDGKMRLIVGADLAMNDVEAILKGDDARYSQVLLKELEAPNAWEKAVTDGVALLAYMVAARKLEVRVAFRKNANTGRAIPIDSVEDGYVHEKWFVMGDEQGNHIYGGGSLNESRTALVTNAENIDVSRDWLGGTDLERVRQAQTDFELLWNNQLAHMEVKTLPDAVREKLVQFSNDHPILREIDGYQPRLKIEPSPDEALRFAVLRDAPKMPGGKYLGMYTAPVELWPHQEIVSHRLVETWPYSYMMCDEVGLGKTIEAALAIRSLVLSGQVKRVLIVAPASLTNQWQRELAQKAMVSFARTTASPQVKHEYLLPDAHVTKDGDLYSIDLNIISSGLASRKERVTALKETSPYDIVLVDEAHYARRQDPKGGTEKAPVYGQLYKTMSEVVRGRTKSLWMATATPMQIDPIEVFDLFSLTNRVAEFQNDPTASMCYFKIVGKLIFGETITMNEWRFLGQSYQQLEATDPYLWNLLQTTCVDSKNRKVLNELPYATKPPKTADQKYLPRPLFAASPLSRVMMRHTRQLLEIYKQRGELKSNLAVRHILPVKAVSFTKAEAEFYDMLETYCGELSRQILKENKQFRMMTYFYLNFLQLRFASSLYAIQMTLRRRLERIKNTLKFDGHTFSNKEEFEEYLDQLQENDESGVDEDDISELTFDALLKNRTMKDLQWEEKYVEGMLAHIDGMSEVPSKITALLSVLESRKIGGSDRMNQTVLFTRFLDSLLNIRKYLKTRKPDLHVGIFSGQYAQYYDSNCGKDISSNHEEIKRLFIAGEIDLLLCTDAAAEGLNLQTADMLINFDMGWNPMKIEQRIGRIDRIGQRHTDIAVLNMCYLGSAEEIVYGRLLERLKEANLVVGVQQISLLPVEPDEFRGLSDHTLSEEEVMERAKERIAQQRRANASMELTADEQYSIYSKMTSAMHRDKISASLENLWEAITESKYLAALGATLEHKDVWRLPSCEDFPGFRGTINREMFSDEVEFATWGNTKVDCVLDKISSYTKKYPKQISRIGVTAHDGREYVGYLVMAQHGPTFVQRYEDLKFLEVDLSRDLSQADIGQATAKLTSIADELSATYDKAVASELINLDYAKLHGLFVRSVAAYLLHYESQQGEDNFWAAIKNIENDGKSILISIPSTEFTGHENELLFPVQINADTLHVPINTIVLQSAVDYAKRVADSMKIKKSQLSIEEVLRRIERHR